MDDPPVSVNSFGRDAVDVLRSGAEQQRGDSVNDGRLRSGSPGISTSLRHPVCCRAELSATAAAPF